MKYLPLIWSGIWRRRGRAVLMLLQIVSAFTLFAVLQGVSSGTRQAIAATHSDRLYVAKSDDRIPVIAVDAEPFFRIYDEVDVSPAAVQALKNTRTGALVGSALAERHRVKVGDRLTVRWAMARRDGSRDWAFDIVGVYSAHGTFGTPPPTALIANFDYVNQARATDVDRSNMFLARVSRWVRS